MPETDAEINHAVAVEVMGWIVGMSLKFSAHGNVAQVKSYLEEGLDFAAEVADWRPTSDLNQAFEVVEAMRKDGYRFEIKDIGDEYKAVIIRKVNVRYKFIASNIDSNPARAICKAALAAKRGKA